MLSEEQNRLITETGRGTPCGELFRRYWQPVALKQELPDEDAAPVPVRIMGEDLVLFRDEHGRPGLIGRHCPHRGSDLSYGRIEGGGLRCLYHGWVLDTGGRCVEQPGEPEGSSFADKIRHVSYPCQEAGEIVFAYLGPGEPPLLPSYGFLDVAPEHRYVSKIIHDCNWLQGNEGGLDPQHLSFLHTRVDQNKDERLPVDDDVAPYIETERTEFGLRMVAVRELGEKTYVRVTNSLLPGITSFPGIFTDPDGYQMHWCVPIDDHHHVKFILSFTGEAPIDRDGQHTFVMAEVGEDFRFKRNRENRYEQDREEMKTTWFSGLGPSFQVHDAYAVESQGWIQDRTQEHLGATDRAVTLGRRVLMDAIRSVQEGRDPQHVVRREEDRSIPGFLTVSAVLPAGVDWRSWVAEQVRKTEERDPAPASQLESSSAAT